MCIDSYSDDPSHAALGNTPLALQSVQSAAPDINAPDGNEPVEIDSVWQCRIPFLEVEPADKKPKNLSFETDSAIGSDTSDISDTTSLTSSILNYKYENGRTYHAFHDGQYIMPNDDKEQVFNPLQNRYLIWFPQERLDLVHHIWMLILRGQLFRAPITEKVQRVLDVGTGTGIWAMDFADQFPGAAVIANDLSAIQPKWVPPNLIFEIDDAESVWPYNRNELFDYIHIRNMGGSISDWSKLFAQSLEHMSPGGWIEVQEHAVDIFSEDGEVPPFTKEMMEKVKEAAKVFGKEMNVAETMHNTLIKAGFEEVQEDKYKVCNSPRPPAALTYKARFQY